MSNSSYELHSTPITSNFFPALCATPLTHISFGEQNILQVIFKLPAHTRLGLLSRFTWHVNIWQHVSTVFIWVSSILSFRVILLKEVFSRNLGGVLANTFLVHYGSTDGCFILRWYKRGCIWPRSLISHSMEPPLLLNTPRTLERKNSTVLGVVQFYLIREVSKYHLSDLIYLHVMYDEM